MDGHVETERLDNTHDARVCVCVCVCFALWCPVFLDGTIV